MSRGYFKHHSLPQNVTGAYFLRFRVVLKKGHGDNGNGNGKYKLNRSYDSELSLFPHVSIALGPHRCINRSSKRMTTGKRPRVQTTGAIEEDDDNYSTSAMGATMSAPAGH